MRLHPLVAACVIASATQAAAGTPRLALTPCRPPGATEDVLCGRLEVSENPAAKQGPRISLNLVVLPALGAEHREPLFELAGGPGVASTSAVPLYTGELRDYRRHRDVVLVDQRGTGGSNPLPCAPEEQAPLARALREMYPPSYVSRCRRELESRADLRFYTTTIAAEDLDRVRAALGYDRIHVAGISYGTRLAQEYVRRHPHHVKSLFLFGVVPPWAPMPLYHAAGAQRALDLVLDDCAADGACAARYPNLRQELRDLLARLRRQPATVAHGGETATLTADVFAESLRAMLYTPAGSRRLPKVVHSAATGDWVPFLESVVDHGFAGADGAYLSVTCAEDVPRIGEREAQRVTAGTYTGDYRVRQQVRACAAWPRGAVPRDFGEEFRSSVPALIYAGYRDPVTPPVWADAVAAQFAGSTVVPIAAEAHMPVGLSHMECWDSIVMRFLDEGRVGPSDLACVPTMKAPPFE